MGTSSTRWRKISGVLIVGLIATAFLVLTWGSVSAQDGGGLDFVTGWIWKLLGPPAATHSSVSASPDTIRADGSSTTELTGQVQDSVNAPVADAFVCFTTTLGTIDSGMGYVEAESTSVVTEPLSPVGWSYLSAIPGASGGRYIEANAVISPTSKVSWNYNGEAVSVRYRKAPDAGKFRFRIDTGGWQTVDAYAAVGAWADVFTKTLTGGAHTIKFAVLSGPGAKNLASSGYFSRVDLFRTGKLSNIAGTVTGTLTSAYFVSPSSQAATVGATMIKGTTSVHVNTLVTMVASLPTTVTVEVDPPKTMKAGANTIGATAVATDNFGLPVVDGTMVGFTTTLPTRAVTPYDYVEVEDPTEVTQVGTWNLVTDTRYSAGNALEAFAGNAPAVVWNFTGTAVSLIYRRTGTPGAGRYVDADVDGTSTRTLDLTLGDASDPWRNEIVLFNNLSAGGHTLTVTKQSASNAVRLDALRSGTTTTGGQAIVTLTSVTQTGTVDVYADVPYGVVSEGARGYAEGFDTLTILAGDPHSAVFVGLPYTTSCGAPSPMNVKVRVRDQYNNLVPNASVALEASLVGTWPGGNPVLTGGTGVASTTYQGYESGTGVITATVDSVVATTTFNVYPGDPVTMTMDAQPPAIYASGLHTSTISLRGEDQCGNSVAECTLVTFTTTAGTFPGPTTTISRLTTAGVASTVLTSTNSIVTATITGEIDGITGTLLVPFIGGPPYELTFMYGPQTFQCGITDTVRIRVRDEWGNKLEGEEVTMSSTQGGLFTPNPGTTDSNGRIDFAYDGSIQAGVGTMQAVVTSNGLSQTETLTVTMGPPISITVTPLPDSIIAATGGAYTSTVCVEAEDACGNIMDDGTVVTLTTSLGTWAGSGGTITSTASGGLACEVLESTNTVGTAYITATVDSMTGTGAVDFVPGPAFLIVVRPAAGVTTTCGATVTVRGRVRDQWNNFLPVGTLVTFSDDLGGSFSPNPAGMLADGFAYSDYMGNTAGVGVITGTHGVLSDSIPVTVTAGSATQVSLTRNPVVIAAGGGVSVITATVSDSCGNAIGAGETVVFTHDSWGTLSAGPWATDANGQASCTLTAAWPPGKVNVTATAGSGVATTFIYFAGAAKKVALSADPTSIVVGGATSNIQASVRDNWNIPVVNGTQVVFKTSLGTIGSTIVTKTTTYNAVQDKALATAVLTSGIQAGTAYVTATVAYGTKSTTVQFVPGGLATFEFDLIGTQTAGVPFNITIRAKDAYGNLATGYTGPAALSEFLGTISPTVTGVFVGGSWTGPVTLTKAGSTWITVQDGLIQQSSGVFTVNPGPPFSMGLSASPGFIPPDGVTFSTLMAMVKDQWNNDVANGTVVNFSTTLGNLSAPSATTTSGVAQVTLTGTTPGTATVTGTSGAASDSETVLITTSIPTATPGPTATATATETPGPSPTATATNTPGPSPTPTETSTPTVTPSPTATGQAVVNGHVDLQARPLPPNSQWQVVLDIEVRNGGVFTYTFTGVTTDQSGDFSVGGITPGIYDIWLKNFHTLSNLKQNVTLNAGPNSVDMGELQDGDASDDNIVNILDFGWLKVQFGTAGPEADFNQDGLVDIVDFGVLKVNFGEMGDVIVTGMPTSKSALLKARPGSTGKSDIGETLSLLQDAMIVLSPSVETAAVGEELSVDVEVDAGSYVVDAIQAYVNLDPAYWDVVDIIEGDVPANLLKSYDTTTGQACYAWASLDSSVQGSFTLCTLKLRAKRGAEGIASIILDRDKTKMNAGIVSVSSMLFDAGVTMASADGDSTR